MITYTIDAAAGLVICRVQHGISVLDVANYIQALMRDPNFTPGCDALVTIADVASIPPFEMLRYLQPLISGWTARRGAAKWALVLPNEVARTMAQTALQHLPLHDVQACCFVHEAEARAWLGPRPSREPAARESGAAI
ncbi:MAG: hypothetical protein Q7S40_01450 [Opitutaceae bacterium]|nr:hypothetical protein [Opitutaceae bacterium]